MRTTSRTSAGLPAWVARALAVPGALAVLAALVDLDDKPTGGVPLRARIGLLGLALLTLAWMAANARLPRPRRW